MAKTQTQAHNRHASHESEESLGRSRLVKKSADEAGEWGKSFIAQLLGIGEHASSETSHAAEAPTRKSGDIFVYADHGKSEQPGMKKAEASLAKLRKTSSETIESGRKATNAEAAINYTREVLQTERFSKQELGEISAQVQQIKAELKKLVASSRILQVQFSEISVEQAPKEIGKYHLNFFEWLLGVIQVARKNVESSGAWLNTSKKKQGNYWNMYKKHGTSFGLSNERAVATQVG